MAKNLMVQGTMSNAGKSIVTAGILRVLKQDGYRVAPFKSQILISQRTDWKWAGHRLCRQRRQE